MIFLQVKDNDPPQSQKTEEDDVIVSSFYI